MRGLGRGRQVKRCPECGRERDDVAGCPPQCTHCLVAGDAWVFGLPAARMAAREIEQDGGVLCERVKANLADAEESVLDMGSMGGQNLRHSLRGLGVRGEPDPMRARWAAVAASERPRRKPSARPADGQQELRLS